jgi:hypothetical protein
MDAPCCPGYKCESSQCVKTYVVPKCSELGRDRAEATRWCDAGGQPDRRACAPPNDAEPWQCWVPSYEEMPDKHPYRCPKDYTLCKWDFN